MTKLFLTGCVAATLIVIGSRAEAATITLTPADMIPFSLNPPKNCEPGCVYTTFGLVNDGSLGTDPLYKITPGQSDTGAFAGAYSTVFANGPLDPQDATITFLSGPPLGCLACYLAVKDGSHSPSYYFFDLSSWNGTDTIALRGFWPAQGSIAHLSIWGVESIVSEEVELPHMPEPATLTLVGLGLLGLARRAKRRAAR